MLQTWMQYLSEGIQYELFEKSLHNKYAAVDWTEACKYSGANTILHEIELNISATYMYMLV